MMMMMMMMELQTSSKCGDDEQTPLPLHDTNSLLCKMIQGHIGIIVGFGVEESGFDLFRQFGEFGPLDELLHLLIS